MSVLVSQSSTPLVFDALPAIKVQHYSGNMSPGNIYTLARIYFRDDVLCLSLCAFEKAPPTSSQIVFAFSVQPDVSPCILTLSPTEVFLGTPNDRTDFSGKIARFAGADEQGPYWGANIEISSQILSSYGFSFSGVHSFYAGIFKSDTQQNAFGSAFPIVPNASMLDIHHMEHFQIVPY